MLNLTLPANYKETYNSLPIVERQYEKFQKYDSIDLLFKQISRINIPKGIAENFGLFLNHKHWEVDNNQIMIESTFDENQLKGLKTKALTISELRGFVPIRWKICRNQDDTLFFMPLEFSNDKGAQGSCKLFFQFTSFFYQVAKLVTYYQLESLLGFAIITRSHIQPNKEDEIYLEASHNSESIVTIYNKGNSKYLNSIPTSWAFNLIIQAECKAFCRLNTSCSTEWACWMEGDDHVRGQSHTENSSHSEEHSPGQIAL